MCRSRQCLKRVLLHTNRCHSHRLVWFRQANWKRQETIWKFFKHSIFSKWQCMHFGVLLIFHRVLLLSIFRDFFLSSFLVWLTWIQSTQASPKWLTCCIRYAHTHTLTHSNTLTHTLKHTNAHVNTYLFTVVRFNSVLLCYISFGGAEVKYCKQWTEWIYDKTGSCNRVKEYIHINNYKL